MNRRAYYVTVYRTNKTHGPFIVKGEAVTYSERNAGAVSTLSCVEIENLRISVFAP